MDVPARYATDPRVSADPAGGFTVRDDSGATLRILYTAVFGWDVRVGPLLNLVVRADGGLARGYATAVQAIDAVLGQPITTAV
jgi:hypothetical protein